MNFASDNAAGIAPQILAAISRANSGAALAYGGDPWTQRVEARFAEIFEREVAVFLVPTGTAANALALAHLTPPWGAVLCHDEAHIATDECGAPEFFGGGIKLVGLAGEAGKIAANTFRRALDAGPWGGPHHVSPAVLSLSQATEAGTIYRPQEIHELADIAHARGLALHVDGARIGNAIARMNASPTRNVCTSIARRRSTSARDRMPDSVTTMRSSGIASSMPIVVSIWSRIWTVMASKNNCTPLGTPDDVTFARRKNASASTITAAIAVARTVSVLTVRPNHLAVSW